MSHHIGRIPWDDVHGVRRYGKTRAYAQSKLANLLFAFELPRRLARPGETTSSLAAHPGFASTDCIHSTLARVPRSAELHIRPAADRHISAAAAAGPSLRHATDPGELVRQF